MNVEKIDTKEMCRKKVSVVIPTFNEADNIGRLIKYLKSAQDRHLLEIIVADGGSIDGTLQEAQEAGAAVVAAEKGRAVQMNAGADKATGDIIYFLHSDTFPPVGYDKMIAQSVAGFSPWGSFRLKFDHQHWFLSFITGFTRLSFSFLRFGDQSLFITRELFDTIGKFKPSQIIFEDTEIARRLRQKSRGRIIDAPVISSARKFRDNGVYRMGFVFIYLWLLYLLRVPHHKILSSYRRLIIQDKI